jgi:uncharacterized small protein (DUF1192 family)
MMTKEENRLALCEVKFLLLGALDRISILTAEIERNLNTEAEAAESSAYGTARHTIGVLEEQVAEISNQLRKLK